MAKGNWKKKKKIPVTPGKQKLDRKGYVIIALWYSAVNNIYIC